MKNMNLWQLIMTRNSSLGLADWLVIGISAAVVIWSWQLPRRHFARRTAEDRGGIGPKEFELRAEWWIKIGTALALLYVALILSLLLRLLGTPGLSLYLQTAYVVVALLIVVGYAVTYCLLLYPRYRKACRLIDAHKSYDTSAKKGSGKKGKAEPSGRVHVNMLPGKAMIVTLVLPVVYYFAMTFVSVQPGVPPSNHDHAWHQLSTIFMFLPGYIIGLVWSLGDDIRPFLPWLRMQRGRHESRAH
jgi:hypothetical protein